MNTAELTNPGGTERAVAGALTGWHRQIGPTPVLLDLHPDALLPRWVDHAYRVRLPGGDRWCYVAEPNELRDDALADLDHLAQQGFGVTVTCRRARHRPGYTLAVEIVGEGS